VASDVFNQGLGQPTSDNNQSVHAHLEREHPETRQTDVFPEVLILVNQPIKDVKNSVFPYSLFFCLQSLVVKSCPQTPCANGLLTIGYYKKKNVGACICLFVDRGLPQPIGINRQRNTHVGVYNTP